MVLCSCLGKQARWWFGRLGDHTNATLRTPQAVPGLRDVIAVAAGQFHSVALTSSGTVKTWGRNNNG